jgi:hypothetical protein
MICDWLILMSTNICSCLLLVFCRTLSCIYCWVFCWQFNWLWPCLWRPAFFFSYCLRYSLNCHAIHAFIHLASTLAVLHPHRLAYTSFCLYLYLSLVEIAYLHSDNYWTHCAAPGTHQGLCVSCASLHCFLSRNITSLDHSLECLSVMIFHCLLPCCGDPVFKVCPFQLLCNSEPAGMWWYWNCWFKPGPVCKSKQPLQLMGHRLNWYLMITELKSPCPKGNRSHGYDLDLSHIINSCQTTKSWFL